MNRIVAISCGLNEPKKNDNIISKRNLYLNYGLLGLCTILKDKGYDVKQFQGEYLSPEEVVQQINSTAYNLNDIQYPVLISMISFLSLDWCREITKILSTEYGLKCIVGGKYVVDGNSEWLKRKLPYVDFFLEGAGESKVEQVLTDYQNTSGTEEQGSCFKKIDYSIVHNYKLYNPSIELARGCGKRCVYCADGMRKMSQVKKAESVIDELCFLRNVYDSEDINLYFQMATFQVDKQWIEGYKKSMKKLERVYNWRCTSRVDVMDKESICQLSELGLKVIDLGLESASPRQLKLMGKTNKPQEYLQRAEEILQIAYQNGVWIKLNILLSAGETNETIGETREWLYKNRKYIKGISANCETIYGPHNNLLKDLEVLGASAVNETDLYERGYTYINLSKEIDYSLARKIALDLSRSVMTADDYFDLKKYGYFPRNYDRKQFYNDLKSIDKKELPFTVEERECI